MNLNMNLKAANTGDQLKHAILLELLRLIPTSSKLTYAETHAGAGIYHSFHQVFEEGLIYPYIEQLREKHQAALEQVKDSAGSLYHHWLRRWWGNSIAHVTYPGSALTVYQYLEQHFPEYQIRLTENDPKACVYLRDAFQSKHAIIRSEPFQENVNWLVEKDPLLLLVDPFAIVPYIKHYKSEIRLDQGEIDFFVVKDLIRRCLDKSWAVLAFWWSSKDYCDQIHSLFQFCATEADAVVREFGDRDRHYRMTLLGLGGGIVAVQGLPKTQDWERSWLRGVISEVG